MFDFVDLFKFLVEDFPRLLTFGKYCANEEDREKYKGFGFVFYFFVLFFIFIGVLVYIFHK